MDSSVGEIYGQHMITPMTDIFGDLARMMLPRGHRHRAELWRRVSLPVIAL